MCIIPRHDHKNQVWTAEIWESVGNFTISDSGTPRMLQGLRDYSLMIALYCGVNERQWRFRVVSRDISSP
jgi:hypothetical protein